MKVHEALEALESAGSASDPILYRGEETTAVDLDLPSLDDASKVRIGYWGKGIRLVKRGTLSGMVRERRRG